MSFLLCRRWLGYIIACRNVTCILKLEVSVVELAHFQMFQQISVRFLQLPFCECKLLRTEDRSHPNVTAVSAVVALSVLNVVVALNCMLVGKAAVLFV